MQIINFQNDFFGIEKRRWFLSNNTSRPIIKSKQISLGVNYANNGWLASVECYVKNVNDITAQSQGFLNQYIFSDAIGSEDVYGIDLLLNKKIKKLSTWLSYTYTNNEYTFNDLKEVNFPNNLEISHSVTFGTSYSMNNIEVSAGINWHTGIPITKPIIGNELLNNQINYQAANSSNLEDYLRVDASAIYNFKITENIKAKAGISIWNAFNHTNIINNYYTIENNTIREVKNKALSFTPNITFRVHF